MRYLLDTNVLSEAARRVPDASVLGWMEARPALELAISVLTLGEIGMGIQLLSDGPNRERLAAWLGTDLTGQFTGRLLPVDEHVSLAWGRLMAEGRRTGRELPVIDGLLLATAVVHGLVFVTRNERGCADRGVPILNPWRSEGG